MSNIKTDVLCVWHCVTLCWSLLYEGHGEQHTKGGAVCKCVSVCVCVCVWHCVTLCWPLQYEGHGEQHKNGCAVCECVWHCVTLCWPLLYEGHSEQHTKGGAGPYCMRGTESNVQRDVLPLTVYVGLARTVHMHRI